MYEKVARQIEQLNKEYLKMWEEVCTLESPTENKVAVDAVGKYFENLAIKNGWKVEKKQIERAGDVLSITMNPDAPKGKITFSGHMDTVFPIGTFGTPAVTKDKEKIYGPGVYDCKGGIVAGVLAMDAMTRCAFKDRPVQLLLQSDEEVNSTLSEKATIEYICEKAKNSIAFLNLEVGEKDTCCIARKGIIKYNFTVTGVSAHASRCATQGASAILEASAKIIELEKMKDENGITCSVGVINGGVASNVVPDKCSFELDVRFSTNEQKNIADKAVRKIANTVYVNGCSCKLECDVKPAMEETEINLQLLEKLNRIYKKVGLTELKGEKRLGGTDAAYITELGIPCVDSLGVSGANLHSKEEFAYIDSLEETAKRLSAVVCLWEE